MVLYSKHYKGYAVAVTILSIILLATTSKGKLNSGGATWHLYFALTLGMISPESFFPYLIPLYFYIIRYFKEHYRHFVILCPNLLVSIYKKIFYIP